MKKITIRGARQHNLKNITVELPRDKFIVITGLSGSGKSTLAFDTIYAEGQRRYVESLSAYARQFLGLMSKPDVDVIEGLSPAISIEQKSTSKNPRSTVGTVTEIYDYLRLLFARIGVPFCPVHTIRIEAQSPERIADRISA
ncbi:MAG: excinuclease ABC subunit UvrA, partial [Methanoregulaceae archaeon]|nr:excinuclease ABC subunit UvrA [Methanoregulaceae archaeon]